MAQETQAAVIPAEFLSQGITPPQLFAMLRARWIWIAAVTILSTVGMAAVSLIMDKTYVSTARLLLDFSVNDPVLGEKFPDMLANSYMTTQLDFIQSSEVLGAAMDKLGFLSDPEWTAGYKGLSGQEGLREFVIGKMREVLDVNAGKESRFVNVSFSAKTPQAAADAANIVANAYLEAERNRVSSPARERSQRYTQQLDELRQKVDTAQQAVTAFREQSGLIDLDQKVDIEAARLEDLSVRLTAAEAARRAADLRLQQFGRSRSSGRGDGDVAILGSALIQDLKTELAQREAKMAELSRVLGRQHPERIALAAEIEAMKAKIGSETGAYAVTIGGDARIASDVEAALRRDVESQREIVLAARSLSDQGAVLEREFDTAKKIYDNALALLDQAELGNRMDYSNVSLASAARPPPTHSKPKARINVMIGFVAGLFLGAASALAMDLANRRVRCREDVERDLGLPVLAELGAPAKRMFFKR